MSLDLINRDPEGINSHVKCAFEDVLAEPDGVHSMDCIWKLTNSCYNGYKNCCYKLSTLLCGCCFGIYWGVTFACTALEQIWCITPMIRIFHIRCFSMQKLWGTCINCCLAPICEACGYCLSQIKITKK